MIYFGWDPPRCGHGIGIDRVVIFRNPEQQEEYYSAVIKLCDSIYLRASRYDDIWYLV